MQIDKLRVSNADGLVPAGQYFKLLATALREANEREARAARPRATQAHREFMTEASLR